MISNTTAFYSKLKDFQDRRRKIEDGYEHTVEGLQRYKGSKAYEEDLKKAETKHEEELKALVAEVRPGLLTILDGMTEAIAKRKISSPTTEQLNLLSTLRMRRKVSREEIARTAQTVKDNPIALGILSEISQDHGYFQTYDHLADEMSSDMAYKRVQALRDTLDDFLKYDTTRASRRAAEYHAEHYGSTEGKLTKRELFSDKQGCFKTLFSTTASGYTPDMFKKFSAVVDGTEGGSE